MDKKKELLKMPLFSLLLAIFYVSAIFVSDIISYKSIILAFIYIALSAVLYDVAFVSPEKKIALYKWLLSLPLSYLVFQYFWQTDYAIRALNWVFPGYGKASAGGNFAGFIQLMLLSGLCIAGGAAGLFITPKNWKSFARVQLIVCIFFGLCIIAAVVCMERSFPSYAYVVSHM